MKKMVILFSVCLMALLLRIPCAAASVDVFDEDIVKIENSISEENRKGLSSLGVSSVDDIIAGGVDQASVMEYVTRLIQSCGGEPLSALLILIGVMLLAAVAESYTYSLRYTETKDVLSVIVSLFIASVIVSPAVNLIASAVSVIKGASTVMTVYLPVMAGMLIFSGHAVSSGGYYAAMVTAAQLLSRFSSSVLAPLLNVFLSLSVSAGICSRVRLHGLVEMIGKVFKYGITFAMSVFIAIIGLNSALSGAADSVANKAVRFGLSSFIPLIGSSISEAYGAIRNSIGVLRSGVGVFVIMAVFAAFAPLLIRTLLWSLALSVASMVGEALSVNAARAVLSALTQFFSALRALLIAVMTAFIISSSVLMMIGGQV